MIPVYAEMGTVNPVVLTPVAELAAGTGQFCTKPGLVLAPSGSGFAAADAATSVGAAALARFTRPVTYQGALEPQLRADNPWSVPRRVDSVPGR